MNSNLLSFLIFSDFIIIISWFFFLYINILTENITLVVVVPLLSRVQPVATPWTVAHHLPCPSLSPRVLLKLASVESMMPSNHLILCHPLLLLLSIFPSIRVFSSESALCIRWPRYWSIPYLHLFSNVYFSGFDIVIFDTGIILFLNLFCRFLELTYWWPNNSHPVFLDEFNGIWTRMEIL